MGSVCSTGMLEENAELRGKGLEFSGKLKKEKIFIKGDTSTDSNASNSSKMQKKRDSGFSCELAKRVSQKGSFLGRASERAVEVLDTLGSGMSKLNASSGFVSGMASRGNKISILAFEVANTITKGAILFRSLSEENIQFLKKEILQSEGVQQLVSTDMKELICLAETDKREELNVFSCEVARFGDMCRDPQWHNLDRYFSRLDLDILGDKQFRVETEKTMEELTSLAQQTAELYHELNAFDRFEQDYQQKIKEMESLNLPLRGESLTIFQSELKHQRKLVRSLQKKSLWFRNLEEIVEKLVDIVTYIHQAICEFLGNYGTAAVKYSNSPQRLGEAGLALHYANIINQINMIASRPTSLPANMRDTLYNSLPNNIKAALRTRLQNTDVTKELPITQVKAEMDKTLEWLVPFATNTTKAHQGFGWVGEWANTSNEFGDNAGKESNLIRLQTLYHADEEKIDLYIIELLEWLHHLISFARSRNQALKPMPIRSPPKKGLDFQSNMRKFLTLDHSSKSKPMGTQLSQEDRSLLEKVIARRRTPGVSKSVDLGAANKKREASDWHVSKSAGSSPVKELFGTRIRCVPQNYNVLDIMDGLSY